MPIADFSVTGISLVQDNNAAKQLFPVRELAPNHPNILRQLEVALKLSVWS